MESVTHRIKLSSNLAAACSRDTSRYAIGGAVFIPPASGTGDGWGVATDGRIAAMAPAEVSGKGPTPIIPAGLIPRGVRDVVVNGRIEAVAGKRSLIGDALEGSFPPVPDVLPEAQADTVWVSLDPALLARLADAIGPKDGRVALGIQVAQKRTTKAIMVRSLDGGGIGVLMPLNPGDEDHSEAWNTRRAEFTVDAKAAIPNW